MLRRKTLAFLLTLAMIFSAFPTVASAANGLVTAGDPAELDIVYMTFDGTNYIIEDAPDFSSSTYVADATNGYEFYVGLKTHNMSKIQEVVDKLGVAAISASFAYDPTYLTVEPDYANDYLKGNAISTRMNSLDGSLFKTDASAPEPTYGFEGDIAVKDSDGDGQTGWKTVYSGYTNKINNMVLMGYESEIKFKGTQDVYLLIAKFRLIAKPSKAQKVIAGSTGTGDSSIRFGVGTNEVNYQLGTTNALGLLFTDIFEYDGAGANIFPATYTTSFDENKNMNDWPIGWVATGDTKETEVPGFKTANPTNSTATEDQTVATLPDLPDADEYYAVGWFVKDDEDNYVQVFSEEDEDDGKGTATVFDSDFYDKYGDGAGGIKLVVKWEKKTEITFVYGTYTQASDTYSHGTPIKWDTTNSKYVANTPASDGNAINTVWLAPDEKISDNLPDMENDVDATTKDKELGFDRDGFSISAWYSAALADTDPNYAEVYADASSTKLVDATLAGDTASTWYALYSQEWQLILDPNLGSFTTAGKNQIKSAAVGKTTPITESDFSSADQTDIATLARTGYTLDYWAEAPNGTGTVGTDRTAANATALSDIITVWGSPATGSTKTIYAIWKADESDATADYTVTFDNSGVQLDAATGDGSGNPNPSTVKVASGGYVGALPIKPVHATGQYDFEGWNEKPNGSGKWLETGTTTKPDYSDSTKDYTYAGGNNAYSPESPSTGIQITEDTTFYAQWSVSSSVNPSDRVTIKFDPSGNAKNTEAMGGKIELTRNGTTETSYADSSAYTSQSHATIDIELVKNVAIDMASILPDVSPDSGYAFMEWVTPNTTNGHTAGNLKPSSADSEADVHFSDEKGTNPASFTPTDNATVYAIWAEPLVVNFDPGVGIWTGTPTTAYQIGIKSGSTTNYDAIGSTILTSMQNALDSSAAPFTNNYQFKEWNTEANGSGTTVDATTELPVSIGTSVTLYAIYENNGTNGVDVTFNVNNSVFTGAGWPVVKKVTSGDTLTYVGGAPTAPTIADYTFTGWYYDPILETQQLQATDIFTAATDLYAHWDYSGAADKVKVTIYKGITKTAPIPTSEVLAEITIPKDGSKKIGEAATVSTPTRDYFSFKEWKAGDTTSATTVSDLSQYPSAALTGDVSIFATWSATAWVLTMETTSTEKAGDATDLFFTGASVDPKSNTTTSGSDYLISKIVAPKDGGSDTLTTTTELDDFAKNYGLAFYRDADPKAAAAPSAAATEIAAKGAYGVYLVDADATAGQLADDFSLVTFDGYKWNDSLGRVNVLPATITLGADATAIAATSNDGSNPWSKYTSDGQKFMTDGAVNNVGLLITPTAIDGEASPVKADVISGITYKVINTANYAGADLTDTIYNSETTDKNSGTDPKDNGWYIANVAFKDNGNADGTKEYATNIANGNYVVDTDDLLVYTVDSGATGTVSTLADYQLLIMRITPEASLDSVEVYQTPDGGSKTSVDFYPTTDVLGGTSITFPTAGKTNYFADDIDNDSEVEIVLKGIFPNGIKFNGTLLDDDSTKDVYYVENPSGTYTIVISPENLLEANGTTGNDGDTATDAANKSFRNSITIDLDGDNTPDYTIYLRRDADAGITLLPGNSPYGMIERTEWSALDSASKAETTLSSEAAYTGRTYAAIAASTADGDGEDAALALWKADAKTKFNAANRFVTNWVPTGGNTAIIYRPGAWFDENLNGAVDATEGANMEDPDYNIDRNDTALFVYNGRASYEDAGYVAVDSYGNIRTDIDREVKVRVMPSNSINSTTNTLIPTETTKTIASGDVTGNTITQVTSTSSTAFIRPDVYTMTYTFDDVDGTTLSADRKLVVLFGSADCDLSNTVNNNDKSTLTTVLTVTGYYKTDRPTSFLKLYYFRILDVDMSGAINNNDKSTLTNILTVSSINPVQYYTPL